MQPSEVNRFNERSAGKKIFNDRQGFKTVDKKGGWDGCYLVLCCFALAVAWAVWGSWGQ